MSAQRQELHDFLEERALDRASGMPTAEEFGTAAVALSYVHEFFVGPIFRRVFKLLNEEADKLEADYRPDPPPITLEDVGGLLLCVTDMRQTLADVARWLDAVEGSRNDLSVAVDARRVELEPTFDEWGGRRGRSKAAGEVLEALGAR